jgi:hypothetical protein
MRPVLLAAATVAGLIAPLAALPAAASVEETCISQSWKWIDRVTQGGRQGILWKCKGDPYYHAQITGGRQGDQVWVFAHTPRKDNWRNFSASGTNGRANTKALTLKDGQHAYVCIYVKGTEQRCSGANPYNEACDYFETSKTTRGTIPKSCLL